MEWLFRPLLKILAEGDPVPVEDIAAETGKPVEEVKQVLQTLPSVELDEQGRVVGYGLTLVPTPIASRLMGSNYMHGAPLTHLCSQRLIGRTVHIASPCHGTGKSVRLTVEPDRVVSVEPSTPLSRLLHQMKWPRFGRPSVTTFTFQFTECAQDWLNQHPESSVLPVEDAFELGRHLGARYEESGPTNGSCCNI